MLFTRFITQQTLDNIQVQVLLFISRYIFIILIYIFYLGHIEDTKQYIHVPKPNKVFSFPNSSYKSFKSTNVKKGSYKF